MKNTSQKPPTTQPLTSILCHECKNEFSKPEAKIGDKVQCPTCGTTLTIISRDEKGTGKTRPVPEEK